MKKTTSRIISFLLALVMSVSAIPFTVVCAQEPAMGTEVTDYKYFSASDIAENGNVSYTSEIDVALTKQNGEDVLNLSVPAGEYGNNAAKMTIAGHKFDFNLVSDYKYMKLVYEADYTKTLSLTLNKYASPSVSGVESWFGSSGTGPKTVAGTQVVYITDLTLLNAKIPNGMTSDYTQFNIVLKILGSGSKTTTATSNLNIKYLAFFKSESDAEAFIPPVPSTEGKTALVSSYSVANDTLSTTINTDFYTYIGAEDIYNSTFISFTDDMDVSLVELNGVKYVKCSIPAGTYNNNTVKMSLDATKLPYNLVSEYNFMKFAYSADYAKTMNMGINPYATPTVSSVETWLSGGGSNPKTTADGVLSEHILDLNYLQHNTDGLDADYTKYTLIFKLLGSGSKTTTETSNLYIKYLAFLGSQVDAEAFDPEKLPEIDLSDYDTDALVETAAEEGAEYIDINVLTVVGTELVLPEIFVNKLVKKLPKASVNVVCDGSKITLSPEMISEISELGADVTLKIKLYDDTVSVSMTDGADELEPESSVRVLVSNDSGDSAAVATLDGTAVPFSGIVAGLPAINTTLPAKVGYLANQYTVFDDTLGHWGSHYIRYATSHGLFNGVSDIEFAPNGTMTRAMALTVLMRLSGEDVSGRYLNNYTDVSSDAWYCDGIEWAYRNAVTDTSAETVRPDEPVTREELAGFIYSLADNMGCDLTVTAGIDFTDYDDIDSNYKDAVDYCAANGIISGYTDGTFKPWNKATRAEVSAMIQRFVNSTLKVNELDVIDFRNVDFDEEDIALTFLAISDVHITSKNSGNRPVTNYEKTVDMAYELANDNKIDLVFLAGDLVQNVCYDTSTVAEFEAFKFQTDTFLDKDTALVYCTGNHDRTEEESFEEYIYGIMSATEADRERYFKYDVVEDCQYELGNRHAIANGYHFLSVGYLQDIEAYCKPLLDKITAEEPEKPVFVQYHIHAPATIYGTSAQANDITEFFSDYPQVVFFSGHTHQALENPRSIWQGSFTAVETAASKYLDDDALIKYSIGVPVNALKGENYGREANLVEVDANGNMRFTMFNAYTKDIIARHTLAAPNESNTHLIKYSDARAKYSMPPVFPTGSRLTLEKIEGTSDIAVRFDQAVHDDIVWYYKMTFSAEDEVDKSYYFSSGYYEETGVADVINTTLYHSDVIKNTKRGHTLTEGVRYTVTLTPYDAWDHAGEPVESEYTA
ncbi:MAG: S-layer homology domain-containing protein [Clostridia bacterium]|nr:S-layer homology domain-containing protein [Clostridia bacterium]